GDGGRQRRHASGDGCPSPTLQPGCRDRWPVDGPARGHRRSADRAVWAPVTTRWPDRGGDRYRLRRFAGCDEGAHASRSGVSLRAGVDSAALLVLTATAPPLTRERRASAAAVNGRSPAAADQLADV